MTGPLSPFEALCEEIRQHHQTCEACRPAARVRSLAAIIASEPCPLAQALYRRSFELGQE